MMMAAPCVQVALVVLAACFPVALDGHGVVNLEQPGFGLRVGRAVLAAGLPAAAFLFREVPHMVLFPLVLTDAGAPCAAWWADPVVAATASVLVASPRGERAGDGDPVDEDAHAAMPFAFSSRAQSATANAS